MSVTPSETRAQLRAILRLLISEQDDAQLLYIPHGEPGMRRMIAALLPLRVPNENDAELAQLLASLDTPIT